MHPKLRWILLGLVALVVIGTLWPRVTAPEAADPAYAQAVLQARSAKDQELRSDSNSPLLPADRLNFVGLEYFAINPTLRVEATFAPSAEGYAFGDSLAIPIGEVSFSYRGRSYTLRAYQETGTPATRLFIPFGDRTNGRSTYGGGRYVVCKLTPGATETILDFNTAYHPYCAYNPRYICPAVPPENKLPFRVEAGERGYAEEVG